MPFLKSLRLDGILSFPPESEPIPLTGLNVLIGPNGSGKSNLIEGIELLHATPTGFASVIREGGGVREWLCKGDDASGIGTIEAHVENYRFAYGSAVSGLLGGMGPDEPPTLRYNLSFVELGHRVEITNEIVDDGSSNKDDAADVRFFYRFQEGRPIVKARTANSGYDLSRFDLRANRELDRKDIKPDESILMQLKDSFAYPELTELGRQFGQIATFREWTFGRYAEVRKPQPTDLAADVLASDSSNLGMLLNQLEHLGAQAEFRRYLSHFLPRFERFSTRVEGGTIQFYLHESGLKQPIPATRLSDGTIRFMAILAQLLSPTPPPLICMEEPELGLHPDAIALLASLLQEASTRTQLIVTTHSDALVSALTEVADSVLVCEYRGGTVLKRVESEKLRFWLDKYRLGEIWRIGEIGGNL